MSAALQHGSWLTIFDPSLEVSGPRSNTLQKCSTSLYDGRSQFLEPRMWCYFNLSFFCSSKNCFSERSGSETDQHIIRSFSKDGIVEDKNWKTRVWFSLRGKENPMWRMNSNSVPSNLLQGKKKENRQAFAKRMWHWQLGQKSGSWEVWIFVEAMDDSMDFSRENLSVIMEEDNDLSTRAWTEPPK